MKERLNLSDEDVLRLLHSLSMAKYKVLGKDPASKILAKTDTFFFNAKFTSPMRRIRVRSPCPSCPSGVCVVCRRRFATALQLSWLHDSHRRGGMVSSALSARSACCPGLR